MLRNTPAKEVKARTGASPKSAALKVKGGGVKKKKKAADAAAKSPTPKKKKGAKKSATSTPKDTDDDGNLMGAVVLKRFADGVEYTGTVCPTHVPRRCLRRPGSGPEPCRTQPLCPQLVDLLRPYPPFCCSQVIAYDKTNRWYKVKYEDGDEEEMTRVEVRRFQKDD